MKPSSPNPPSPTITSLAALQLAFTSGYEGHHQPQLVSLDTCNACRESVAIRLRLTDRMPPSLSALFFDTPHVTIAGQQSNKYVGENGNVTATTTRGEILSVTPASSPELRMQGGASTWDEKGGICVRLARYQRVLHVVWAALGVSIQRIVSWPGGVRRLTFLEDFNQDLRRVLWPEELRELTFREGFNQPIDDVVFPKGLERLSLGADFNQDIQNASFPPALTFLSLGASFNHPLEGVKLPKSLQRLVWGPLFDQPVERVRWPPALQSIAFGDAFNNPVEQAEFPARVQSLQLGKAFNQQVERVAWPQRLESLSFGHDFNHPVAGMSWPEGVKEVRVLWE